MSDLKQLKEELEALQEKVELALIAENTERLEVDTWPQANGSDTYYTFTDEGEVSENFYDADTQDDYLQSVGNFYRTKEDAETALLKQQATVRVLNKMREIERGVDVNWIDNPVTVEYDIEERMWIYDDQTDYQTMPSEYITCSQAAHYITNNMADDLHLMYGIPKP